MSAGDPTRRRMLGAAAAALLLGAPALMAKTPRAPAPATTPGETFCHDDQVRAVAFLGNDVLLAAGAGMDPTVRAWDIATGAERWRATGHNKTVNSLAASPDGKTVASCGEDRVVRLWNAATGAGVGSINLSGRSDCKKVAFSPDGKIIAAVDFESVYRWKAADRASLPVVKLGEGLQAFAFSPDSKVIATGGYDGIQMIDLATGTVSKPKSPDEHGINALVFSPDGKLLAWGGSGLLGVWDAKTLAGKAFTVHGGGYVYAVAFSPDGKALASAAADHSVRIWNPATATQIASIGVTSDTVFDLAMAPDGARVGIGLRDKEAAVIPWKSEPSATSSAAAGAPWMTPDRLAALCDAAGAATAEKAGARLGEAFPVDKAEAGPATALTAVKHRVRLPDATAINVVTLGGAPLGIELEIRNRAFEAARERVEKIVQTPLKPVTNPIPIPNTFTVPYKGKVITLIRREGACTRSLIKCTRAP